VSPVFRHGGLRLYLLKLLDEAPRHGYEVIRLLQDRFLGVYSPSPGTIYPRLARLEEEGLVTHDEVDGKKVYRITDKGREEISARLDDLAELEEGHEQAPEQENARDRARRTRDEVRESARRARDEARRGADGSADTDDAARLAADSQHEEARRARQQREDARQAAREGQQRARGGRKEWADWASSQWPGWTGWRERPWGQGGRGWPGTPGLDVGMFRDLERLAVDFGRELRKAAWNTESIGENALGDLRSILEEALARVKNEVFRGAPPDDEEEGQERGAPADS
jgi:DNA-binding PadR family transcriptional regulator